MEVAIVEHEADDPAQHADADADASVLSAYRVRRSPGGFADVVVRRAKPARAVALVVWSNLVATPPLVAATLLLDGPDKVIASLLQASPSGWMVVLWQAYANAVLGYGVWNWLLARHPASRIAPLALFAPVFGLGASAWYLAEPLPGWKLAAAAAVIGGVLLTMVRVSRPARACVAKD